jgi:hypothetical protein
MNHRPRFNNSLAVFASLVTLSICTSACEGDDNTGIDPPVHTQALSSLPDLVGKTCGLFLG